MYCSPALLQFMKEGNVVLVLVLSCIVGLQACTRARFVNIVWILAGASMAVSGQAHLVTTGLRLPTRFAIRRVWKRRHGRLDDEIALQTRCTDIHHVLVTDAWPNDLVSQW